MHAVVYMHDSNLMSSINNVFLYLPSTDASLLIHLWREIEDDEKLLDGMHNELSYATLAKRSPLLNRCKRSQACAY